MARKTKPRTYHHGDLREALVAAGTALVEEGGVAAFTLRECARKAGVSHAAPKNHFASVEVLIAEIAARGYEDFHAALDAATELAEQTPGHRLVAMGHAYVAFARARPGVFGVMFRRSRVDLGKTPHLEQASRAAWLQLVAAVTAVIGPGREDTNLKAAHVWSLVHGIANLVIDKRLPANVSVEDLLTACLEPLPDILTAVG